MIPTIVIKVTYNYTVFSFTLIYVVPFFLLVILFLYIIFYLYTIFLEMYLIGHRRNQHSNQYTTSSIGAYHGPLKRWMLVDNRDKRGRRIDFLVWRLTNFVVSHYMYMQSGKLNEFVLNKFVQTTMKNNIARAKMISEEDINHPTEVGGL